jgi:hypothetical protein
MRWFSTLLSFAAIGLLSGCPTNLDTPRYPTSQPAAVSLAGSYIPTAETKSLIVKAGGYGDKLSSIQLNADGTFRFENVPDWWRTDFGTPSGGFDSGGGTWKTAQHQGWWVLQLGFSDTKQFSEPHRAEGMLTEANLIGQKAPYDLALTIGDPDQGREMRFSRVLAAPDP